MPRPRPRHRLLALLLLLSLPGTAARAGSATAESVWDRSDARQRALQQVPRGATVGDTECEEIAVGTGNDRYRCTVFYDDPAAPAPPSGTQPDPAHPRP